MERIYGFIREKLDIKILILYILRRMPEPITFEELTELAICDGGISYFDYAECVSELAETGHLRRTSDKYGITAKGIRNGEAAEKSLPFSVRALAEAASIRYRREKSRNAMVKASHSVNPDGSCCVNLSLSDGVGEIVSLNLFAAGEEFAEVLEKGFRKDAENIYNTLISMMLG